MNKLLNAFFSFKGILFMLGVALIWVGADMLGVLVLACDLLFHVWTRD